jgi:hypothetical protein
MNYTQSAAFMKDLHKVLMKHGMTAISGPADKVQEASKNLEGYHFFVTKGEKIVSLRGGEQMRYESSMTLKMKKNRYKPENHEDDGN